MKRFLGLLIFGLVGLSACGGGSGDEPKNTPLSPQDKEALRDLSTDLHDSRVTDRSGAPKNSLLALREEAPSSAPTQKEVARMHFGRVLNGAGCLVKQETMDMGGQGSALKSGIYMAGDRCPIQMKMGWEMTQEMTPELMTQIYETNFTYGLKEENVTDEVRKLFEASDDILGIKFFSKDTMTFKMQAGTGSILRRGHGFIQSQKRGEIQLISDGEMVMSENGAVGTLNTTFRFSGKTYLFSAVPQKESGKFAVTLNGQPLTDADREAFSDLLEFVDPAFSISQK